MSNDVDNFELLVNGKVVLERDPNGCMACLSRPYLRGPDEDEDDDEDDDGIPESNEVDTLRITFEDSVCWRDFSHPLIQKLSPGMEKTGEYTVTVPLWGIPFDQVITALRIVRDFRNVRDLVDNQKTSLNSDSGPCFVAYDEAIYIKALADRDIRDWSPGDIASMVSYTGYKRALGFEWTDETDKLLKAKLEAGEINPGWMPPFNEFGGYLKAYYCVPPKMIQERHKTGHNEAATYHIQVQQWMDSYAEKYGVHPCLSVDHPICVTRPLTPIGTVL